MDSTEFTTNALLGEGFVIGDLNTLVDALREHGYCQAPSLNTLTGNGYKLPFTLVVEGDGEFALGFQAAILQQEIEHRLASDFQISIDGWRRTSA